MTDIESQNKSRKAPKHARHAASPGTSNAYEFGRANQGPTNTVPLTGAQGQASSTSSKHAGNVPAASQAGSTARIPVTTNASQYSRSAYGSGSDGNAEVYSRNAEWADAAPMKPASVTVRTKKKHRVAKTIAALLLLALIAVAGAGFWFSSQLDKVLSTEDKTLDAGDVLASPGFNAPFYTLVLGSDSREGNDYSLDGSGSADSERSDVMILARIDMKNRQLTLVTIPRDTPYNMPDGTVGKINEVYAAGGAKASIKAISELTGAPISHFAEIHISELQQMVDLLGGVEVDVDTDLSVKDVLTGETISIPAGTQTLNGQQAQVFARARHEYGTNQDAHRQDNVRTLATAIIRKAIDRPFNEIPGAILQLAQFVSTDVRAGDLVGMGLAFATGSGKVSVYSGTGPYEGAVSAENGGKWLCYENPQGWAKLMSIVDSGGNPAGLDYSDTAILH